MKKLPLYAAAGSVTVAITLFTASLLYAKQKDPRTTIEKECDNAYARCLVNCSKNDMQCIHACDRGWNNCNGYTGSAHKPPRIHLPTGPLETLPGGGVNAQKSAAKASPSPSPTPSPSPKAGSKKKSKDKQ